MNEFHKHLDECKQCEQHPFELCPVGVQLIHAEVQKPVVLPKNLMVLMGTTTAGSKK